MPEARVSILANVKRLCIRYMEERGEQPSYLVLDPASYRLLVGELWLTPAPKRRDLETVYGLEIVVLDLPELCAVVGRPWAEAQRRRD
jgi:hypothetical protein